MDYATAIQGKNIKYGVKWNNFTYMKFIYVHCGEETKLRDPRSWKYSGPYGIWTHDLCDTGAVLYQLS